MELYRKGNKEVLKQKKVGELEYLTFDNIEKTGIVKHAVTTRVGGVSQGIYASMNFGFQGKDDKSAVNRNYEILTAALGSTPEDVVCTDQTHTVNIRIVSKEDAGKGVLIPRDYSDVDGLVTNEKNLVLAVFYADCVPILFVDPKKEVIGAVHSGWRGTVGRIGREMINIMKEKYKCDPADIIVGIGPSICQSCYEVSDDVAQRFLEEFREDIKRFQIQYVQNKDYFDQLPGNSLFPTKETDVSRMLLTPKENDKYLLNLWMANFLVCFSEQIKPENIAVTDLCTCCNPQYLFSHRATQGKRGVLGAFIKLDK